MYKPLKPATTFSDQVSFLVTKGLIIPSVADCELFISRTNYYRLKGYLLPFVDRSIGKCRSPIQIGQIVGIYNFDIEIRNLLALTIEKIEIYLRTQFSYFHAHQYGPEGYMDAVNFNSHHNHVAFTGHINRCINDNIRTPVIQHHITTYGNHFPVWVMIDFFSLGELSYFYTGMKNRDKATLAMNLYGLNYQTLTSWLKCLADLRNRCAHYSRLYYWKFPSIPRAPVGKPFVSDQTLFSQIYMLKYLYPEQTNWITDFVKPLSALMKRYRSSISRAHIGFPYRWRSMLSK